MIRYNKWVLCLLWLCACGYGHLAKAQTSGEAKITDNFYATASAADAASLKTKFPNDIEILYTKDGQSAVWLTERGAHELHHKVLVHGPGYVYEPSLAAAIHAVDHPPSPLPKKQAFNYTIDQDAVVLQSLGLVNNVNIKNTILQLENYGTRYHTYSAATQSVVDMKAKWEAMATGRGDISVRLVNHANTNMPSAVLTIQGNELPEEYVIIGGHIDSTSPDKDNAPGADDDASGIATITEAARVLIEMGFKPKRTVEIMAYAAEEVGLRGSREIATDYRSRNVNVVSYVQFDMTNYKGSPEDIFIVDDSYTSPTLNNYLIQLMDHYNASGPHQITYGTTRCNYGCSDHYSWAQEGYDASFPFESKFGQHNPFIHTVNDRFSRSPVPEALHAVKFAKLALEFIIETAKTSGVSASCAAPGGLATSNVGNTTATVSWGAVGTANGYAVRYRAQGAAAWLATNTTTNSTALSGLAQATTYDFQVRAECPDGNSGYSPTASFTTTGVPSCNTVASFPYTASFESDLGLWEQEDGDDFDWSRDANGTPSNGTGPGNADDGDFYVYTEASTPNHPTKVATLYSPCFELTPTKQYTVSFGYHMYGAGMGALAVAISTDFGRSWSEIWARSGDQGNAWNKATIDLSAYAGTIKLRFTGTTSDNYQSDMAIDNLVLKSKGSDPVNYCASNGNSANDEWISQVKIGTIDNASGSSPNGYTDYTNLVTTVNAGTTVALTITPAWRGRQYREGYGVWIDYNQNGAFEATELALSQAPTTDATVSASIAIPATALAGNTRMRVSMKYNATPVACEAFAYGEVEDYTLAIAPTTAQNQVAKALSALEKGEVPRLRLVPNPTSGIAYLGIAGVTAISIYSLAGVAAKNFTYKHAAKHSEIDVSDLKDGVYLIRAETSQGTFMGKLYKTAR